jgi:hypothetical protein
MPILIKKTKNQIIKWWKHNMEFESLLGKIVRVETERHELPLFGRLLHATSGYLTIERRNGLVVIIRADQVASIAPTYRQPESA